MPVIESNVKLDFSDVLLKPKRSEIASRNDVLLERSFTFKYSKRQWTGIPIIVANMDTTGTIEMAKELEKHKMITCLHKYYKADEIPKELNRDYFAITTGISDSDIENLNHIVDQVNPHFICIDVANGYSTKFVETVKKIRLLYPHVTLMGGNVVTEEMVLELVVNGGLDIVKIGIGSGSVCTTRLQTGVGYPQFSAILECANAAHGIDAQIISDGGIVNVGDFGKAFGAGADFIMCGSMFAGHDECMKNNIIITENGKKYCVFYGMSSDKAMNKYSGGVASYRSSEGKCVKIPYKGPVESTILNILGGLRSTMTYIGALKLKHIPKCAHFIQVNNQVNKVHNGMEI